MNYQVNGPYSIQLTPSRMISKDQKALWINAEDDLAGLSDAYGVYLFGISSSGGSRIYPWYVGKTEKLRFRKKALNDRNQNLFNRVINDEYNRAKGHLYLLPLLTPSGRLSKSFSDKTIDYLEKLLIAYAYRANTKLCNIQNTKLLKTLVVPGIINTPQRPPYTPERTLKKTLGLG